MRLLNRAAALGAVGFIAAFFPIAASADGLEGHLPIVTISPITTWTAAQNAIGTPAAPAVVGVPVDFTGTATIPIYKGVSFSFDRIVGGLFNSTFAGVTIPGVGEIQPGFYRDLVYQYRLDYVANKSLTVETGLINRHRICCPGSSDNASPASTESHVGYLGLTYTAPALKKINYLTFIANVTGRTANHNPSPNALAGIPPGLDVGHKRLYGATYSLTGVLPLSRKGDLLATATAATGLFDYFENFPFPFYYNLQAYTIVKQINPYVGVQVGEQNLWQTKQGSPFPNPGPGVIHVAEFTFQVDFHLDFNKLLAAPKAATPAKT